MKSSFLRLLTSAAVALAISATVSFAQETSPEKKDGEKSPCCPTEAPKSEIFNHCGSCGKKEEPTTAPATEPAKTEPVKTEISNHCGSCGKKDEPTTAPATEPAKTEPAKTEPVKQEECPEKKDGEKCPAAPSEAPKA
jgi:hypothetical protein